ncbi:MAG: 16S rRNA (guanine(527)-N(7))-methyltransferase RsmG [Candidatus Kryptonium sp.]|nr:16S rRNA (guanine(527)-N(7))-methyltransferase RsmG [Candidatus Kryptonium sp.]MDW8108599.1 16S rRNA (guanine(527)-N(7))-methyltransferase RsmG [Candidatus Kryptonium sp.]
MEFDEFISICKLNGLEIGAVESELLKEYVSLLRYWNEKVNLISRKESDIWGRHILHCISPLFKFEIKEGSTILDLGTGGGLPGIPWAILKRNSNFVLLDGTRKKIEAVSDIVKNLGLKNVKTIWGRAEEISKLNEFKGKFDYVLCRAVAELKKLVRWSIEFLKFENFPEKILEKIESKRYLHTGYLLAFKGGDVEKEINDAMKTSLVCNVEVFDLDFNGAEKVGFEDKKIVLLRLRTKKV